MNSLIIMQMNAAKKAARTKIEKLNVKIDEARTHFNISVTFREEAEREIYHRKDILLVLEARLDFAKAASEIAFKNFQKMTKAYNKAIDKIAADKLTANKPEVKCEHSGNP